MPEENDLNKAPVVTEQDLNNADAVNQQDLNAGVVNQEKQDDKLADGTDANKTVPYAKLKEATDARKVAEEQSQSLQNQMAILQANQQPQVQRPVQQVGSTYEQAMIDLGLTSEDLYGDNIVRVQNRKAELDTALQQHQATSNANNQFIASHSDFIKVVGSVNPATGQIMSLSPEAATLLQKKPYLTNASAQVAYEEVMQARKFAELESKSAVNQEQLNRQELDNISQPLGGSAAGAGTGGDTQQPMMSRQQVQDIEQKLADGENV